MKIINKTLIIFILIISVSYTDIIAQNECGTTDFPGGSAPFVNDFFGGYLKPQRTDYNNGVPIPSSENASFNMLFVFIQFADENEESGEWLIGDPPTYMDKFLSLNKNASGQFWNRYDSTNQILSDYYQEMSKGAFHVTGESRNIITTYSRTRYINDTGYVVLLNEIYTKLKNDLSINWLKFDKWSRNNLTNNYVFAKDKYLDMLGLFFRTSQDSRLFCVNAAGYVPLCGPQYTVFANSQDTVKISPDRSDIGSGFVAIGNLGPLPFNRALGIAMHEYGHYLFSNDHSTSGIMTSNGGISINDLFMSGYEKYKLGILDTQTVNFDSASNYTVGDISGRNGSTQLLRVPVSSSEFFLIENRRKISQYDRYMLGDTSQNSPFRDTKDYGKGLYIYHNNNINLNYANNVDVECADGLWNWSSAGTTTPDWSPTQPVPLIVRTSIPSNVNNDAGYFYNLTNSDGVSACSFFSIGRRHAALYQSGTDKIYTNYPDFWTSREIWGDRFDAWNVGYNEIFSPYSNPNTKTAANFNSEIFIYYNALNSGIANLKIYKVGQPFTLDEILTLTPPSRPMGIVLSEYYIPNTTYCNPKIIWNHNSEPDMTRTGNVKRYKIFKATQPNMSLYPLCWQLLIFV